MWCHILNVLVARGFLDVTHTIEKHLYLSNEKASSTPTLQILVSEAPELLVFFSIITLTSS